MEVEDVKPSKSALDAETTRFREEASRRRATMIRQMMSKPVRVKVDANPRNLCAEISAENRQLKETQRQLIAANGRLQTDLGRARRNARVYDSAATKALADLERYKQCAEEREEELQAMRMELESSKTKRGKETKAEAALRAENERLQKELAEARETARVADKAMEKAFDELKQLKDGAEELEMEARTSKRRLAVIKSYLKRQRDQKPEPKKQKREMKSFTQVGTNSRCKRVGRVLELIKELGQDEQGQLELRKELMARMGAVRAQRYTDEECRAIQKRLDISFLKWDLVMRAERLKPYFCSVAGLKKIPVTQEVKLPADMIDRVYKTRAERREIEATQLATEWAEDSDSDDEPAPTFPQSTGHSDSSSSQSTNSSEPPPSPSPAQNTPADVKVPAQATPTATEPRIQKRPIAVTENGVFASSRPSSSTWTPGAGPPPRKVVRILVRPALLQKQRLEAKAPGDPPTPSAPDQHPSASPPPASTTCTQQKTREHCHPLPETIRSVNRFNPATFVKPLCSPQNIDKPPL